MRAAQRDAALGPTGKTQAQGRDRCTACSLHSRGGQLRRRAVGPHGQAPVLTPRWRLRRADAAALRPASKRCASSTPAVCVPTPCVLRSRSSTRRTRAPRRYCRNAPALCPEPRAHRRAHTRHMTSSLERCSPKPSHLCAMLSVRRCCSSALRRSALSLTSLTMVLVIMSFFSPYGKGRNTKGKEKGTDRRFRPSELGRCPAAAAATAP